MITIKTLIFRANVKRSWRSKWRVSLKEFRAQHYPTYCPGWIVLYSRDVVGRLYEGTQHEPYFWIDDVLVTGIVAKKVKARHFSIKPWELGTSIAKEMMVNGTYYKEPGRYVIGPYELKPEEISQLWALAKNSTER
jgi:hypothetical protein